MVTVHFVHSNVLDGLWINTSIEKIGNVSVPQLMRGYITHRGSDQADGQVHAHEDAKGHGVISQLLRHRQQDGHQNVQRGVGVHDAAGKQQDQVGDEQEDDQVAAGQGDQGVADGGGHTGGGHHPGEQRRADHHKQDLAVLGHGVHDAADKLAEAHFPIDRKSVV